VSLTNEIFAIAQKGSCKKAVAKRQLQKGSCKLGES
jgi:hypothetical protein